MIRVTFYPNGFVATGHANSNEYGHDLVCAGVSAIIMGALNWFDTNHTVVTVGKNEIKVIGQPEKISHFLDLLFIQLSALLHDNGQYIAIEKASYLYE